MAHASFSRRHLLGVFGLGAFGSAALAACGGAATAPTQAPSKAAEAPKPAAEAPKPAEPTKAAAAPAPTPVPTIKPVVAGAGQTVIRYMDRADVRYQKFVEGWIPTLEQKNAKIKLQNEPIPQDWEQKVTAALAAGAAADVVAVYGHWFRIYQEKGQLVELNQYVAKDLKPEDVSDFFQGQWKGMALEGKQLAIPQYININGLYVNNDALKEMNVENPGNDYTYDQKLQFITKLHKKSGDKVDRWGYSTGWTADGFIRIISLIWGLGGEINPANDLTRFSFTKPETVKAFQWIHDLAWKHKVGAVTQGDMGGLSSADAFWAGKLGTLFEGMHLFGVVPEGLKMEWDVLPPPRGVDGARWQRSSMDGYFIAKSSKAPDLAWEVIKDATLAETMKTRAKVTYLIPARKSAVGVFVETFPTKNVKALTDTMDDARPDPRSLWKNAAPTWLAVKPTLEELFLVNKVSVEEAMNKMQAAAEKAQKEG
jgi:ABC-type glycerol-3-phosphate transport system substrate-binding protein